LKTLPIVALAALCMSMSCLQRQGDYRGDEGATLAPASAGGELQVVGFTVPAGQAIAVTTDLALNVSGDVRVVDQLVASPAASDSTPGANITIIAQGSVEISGLVPAGALTVQDDPAACVLGSTGQGAGPNEACTTGGLPAMGLYAFSSTAL
jgi:hypothetical protein